VEFGSPTVTVTVTGSTPLYPARVPVGTAASVAVESVQSGPVGIQLRPANPSPPLPGSSWPVYGTPWTTSGMANAWAV
jgi:hypothetical protein